MTVDLSAVRAPRPHRADAARNFDAVLAAAQEVFTEFGADAPLDEVARRAGVGIATLYRNFPTREHLLENVFLTEVEAVCRFAEQAAVMSPWTGITTWLRRFIELVATSLDHDSSGYRAAAQALHEAGGPLLKRAQDDGTFRADVDIDDVLRMIMAYAAVNFASADQRDRMLNAAFDGLTRAAAGQGSRQG